MSLLMKKLGRLNALVLGLLLLSLTLVACSDSGASTPTPGQTTSASQTTASETTAASDTTAAATTAANNPSFTPVGGTTPTAAATPAVKVIDANLKGTLTIWDGLPDREAGYLKDLTSNFTKAYPGVKLTIQHYAGDELVYAATQAAKSGKLPDLLLASADYVTDLQGAQAIQPADKLLDKSLLDSYASNALAGSNQGGTQWGAPFTYNGAVVMLYNKKMIPNPPTTWEQLGQAVRPLYDTNKKQIGLALDVNEPVFLTSLLGGFGGSVLDGQGKPTLDTPQMVDTLSYIQQLLKDRTVRGESRQKNSQIEYAFQDGRLGINITSDVDIARYANGINPTDSDAKLDLGIAPLPKVDKTGQAPVPFNNSNTFFISKQVSGDQAKLVSTLLNWLGQPVEQAAILDKFKILPATKSFLASDAVKSSPLWSGLLAQLDQSKPEPAGTAMRVVWEALRPSLETVVAGTVKPADAAKQMQQTAQDKLNNLAVTK